MQRTSFDASENHAYVFASAVCFFVAATMQFPFREEEGCGSASADTTYRT